MITIGLVEVLVGEAAPSGTMPTALTKIGKVYKDTATIEQEAAEVTEHFEEGVATPVVRTKQPKIQKVKFSLMDADVQMLIDYVGGENVGTDEDPEWGFDGTQLVANKSFFLKTKKGLDFEIPNGDVECVVKSDMSSKGIFLVEFTITPSAVVAGGAIRAIPKP